MERHEEIAFRQPEIEGGPWWIEAPDGKKVGAVYSWPDDHKELWFLVASANGNGAFAPWPHTNDVVLKFVEMTEPGQPVLWDPGAWDDFNALPAQDPAVTWHLRRHSVQNLADETW